MLSETLSNVDIVVLAVLLCGGDSQQVDTEDVAVKASEIAPGRFAWRKYRDQISIDAVRKRLWDATKPEKGGYLIGSERQGWSITPAGLARVRATSGLFGTADLARDPLSKAEQRQRRVDRERMLASEAYRVALEDGPDSVSYRDAELFFRLNDYVVGIARERRLNRILAVFGDDSELGPLVSQLAERVRKGGAADE